MSDDLPGTFDEWPLEDQLEYLENTRKKRDIVETILDRLDVDAHVRDQSTLKKRDWARILLAVREVSG